VARPPSNAEPVHLLVDSTGLKLCGAGEWLVEKHGTSRRRSWRKLHIGVDADTGRIVAAALTTNDFDDGSQAVGMSAKASISPLSELAREAGEAQCAFSPSNSMLELRPTMPQDYPEWSGFARSHHTEVVPHGTITAQRQLGGFRHHLIQRNGVHPTPLQCSSRRHQTEAQCYLPPL